MAKPEVQDTGGVSSCKRDSTGGNDVVKHEVQDTGVEEEPGEGQLWTRGRKLPSDSAVTSQHRSGDQLQATEDKGVQGQSTGGEAQDVNDETPVN